MAILNIEALWRLKKLFKGTRSKNVLLAFSTNRLWRVQNFFTESKNIVPIWRYRDFKIEIITWIGLSSRLLCPVFSPALLIACWMLHSWRRGVLVALAVALFPVRAVISYSYNFHPNDFWISEIFVDHYVLFGSQKST